MRSESVISTVQYIKLLYMYYHNSILWGLLSLLKNENNEMQISGSFHTEIQQNMGKCLWDT
jgi:hypothetical protein